MATAIVVPALSTNRSPTTTLPSSVCLYTVPSKPSIQIQQQQPPLLSSPSSPSLFTKHSSPVVPEDSLTVAAAAEVATLANTTVMASKDAISSAVPLGEIMSMHTRNQFTQGDSNAILTLRSHQKQVLVEIRRLQRRVRRKRRKCPEQLTDDAGSSDGRCFNGQCSSRSARSGYLTTGEEAEFSHYIKEGAKLEAAKKKLCKASKDHEPSNSEWLKAAAEAERGNVDGALLRARECRERIILSYKRLVISIATPYEGKGLSRQDLVQEGCIGLLRGAERFDSKRGYKLSTYVYWWIKQAIIKAIAKKSRIVRLPGSMNGLAAKVADANSFLTRRLGRQPTYEEVADLADASVSKVQLICERSKIPISIDQPVTDEGMTLKDIIPGPEETRPETMVTKQLITRGLKDLLQALTEREAYILRLHYGLNGETAQSFEEIGRLVNLSRERVRQIHWAALRKLQSSKSSIESLVKSTL